MESARGARREPKQRQGGPERQPPHSASQASQRPSHGSPVSVPGSATDGRQRRPQEPRAERKKSTEAKTRAPAQSPAAAPSPAAMAPAGGRAAAATVSLEAASQAAARATTQKTTAPHAQNKPLKQNSAGAANHSVHKPQPAWPTVPRSPADVPSSLLSKNTFSEPPSQSIRTALSSTATTTGAGQAAAAADSVKPLPGGMLRLSFAARAALAPAKAKAQKSSTKVSSAPSATSPHPAPKPMQDEDSWKSVSTGRRGGRAAAKAASSTRHLPAVAATQPPGFDATAAAENFPSLQQLRAVPAHKQPTVVPAVAAAQAPTPAVAVAAAASSKASSRASTTAQKARAKKTLLFSLGAVTSHAKVAAPTVRRRTERLPAGPLQKRR